MYLDPISAITSGVLYVVSSMTWHQWHHTASRSSRMNLFSRLAWSNMASDQGCHSIAAGFLDVGAPQHAIAATKVVRILMLFLSVCTETKPDWIFERLSLC